MTTFSWLHLTDLHYGVPEYDWMWSEETKTGFYRDLKKLHEACGPWDLILFTGDLTDVKAVGNDSGKRPELWKKLDEKIEEIRQKVAKFSDGEEPLFLAVPGNHDLERSKEHDPAAKCLAHRFWDGDVQKDFWSEQSKHYRSVVKRAVQRYSEWWEPHAKRLRSSPKFRDCQAKDYREGWLPGEFSVTIEKEGCRLGIIGLNTSFMHVVSGRKEGEIALHLRQITEACGERSVEWARRHHACLLMTHHPPEWLDERHFERWLSNSMSSDSGEPYLFCHLCGHLHEARHDDKSLYQFQARSLFGIRKPRGEKVNRRHGYAAGRIELFEQNGTLRFWPRAAMEKNPGKLGPDTELELTENNHTKIVGFQLPITCRVPDKKTSHPSEDYAGVAGKNKYTGYSPEICIRREPLVKNALTLLRKHVPLVFSGPRGFGKRWLMQDVLHELNRNDRYNIKYVDIGALEETSLSIAEFLRWLAEQIDPKLAILFDYSEYSDPRWAITGEMKRYLRKTTQSFVLAIGNADHILDRPFGRDFFSLLRDWLNRVGVQPDSWSKFLLLLSSERSVSRLNEELRPAPPFNIGEEISVGTLTNTEVPLLAEELGISITNKQKDDIRQRCGNQPFLTAMILQHMGKWGDEWKGTIGTNIRLREYIDGLKQELREEEGLFETFEDIWKGLMTGQESDRRWQLERLERLGLVVIQGSELKVSGTLYGGILQ
uniref:Calcineurin-like phosphoesterase n=1 Tax=Candidatus Kentrum sp. LPFa TaxID=2126335 RepID=A0A450XMN3_9GAMM|nr:MAG: Calcineurin-like phosphoesterase [Candidatus Kentron sp. LPFa]VFK30593.1 MAG: Calcineurin-like phosphoesterase [Candidatus Kentron sp. LPFa]